MRYWDSAASLRPTKPLPGDPCHVDAPSLCMTAPSSPFFGWASGSSRARWVPIYLCLCVPFVIGPSLMLFLGAWQRPLLVQWCQVEPDEAEAAFFCYLCLSQGLPIEPWIAWNFLYRTQTYRGPLVPVPRVLAGVTCVCHHAYL